MIVITSLETERFSSIWAFNHSQSASIIVTDAIPITIHNVLSVDLSLFLHKASSA